VKFSLKQLARVGFVERVMGCVASGTSGQMASAEMRDFDLLQAACRESEVHEQTRISAIHGGTED
jgi:hypothetical protein